MARRVWVGLVALLAMASGCSRTPVSTSVPKQDPNRERIIGGTVAFTPPSRSLIFLHGFEVELRRGDRVVATAHTDEHGNFAFRDATHASLQVCWRVDGWLPGCASRGVPAGSTSFAVDPIDVVPDPARGHAVWGTVTFSDGVPARVPAAGRVRLHTATVENLPGRQVPVNADGEFVLAGVAEEPPFLVTRFGDAISSTRVSTVSKEALAIRLPTSSVSVLSLPAAGPTLTPFHPCPATAPVGCSPPSWPWLTFKSNAASETATYYLAVDPNKKRLTLRDWWTTAGFNADGSVPSGAGISSRATYSNDNDLGFGRDMGILQTTHGVFAYVTNYLNAFTLQDPKNAELAATRDAKSLVATVCMEYARPDYDGPSSPGSGSPIVKFFVYGANGDRLDQAALDPSGDQPLPGLCLNCHGGQDAPVVADLHARFLPFDVETFHYFPSGKIPYKELRALNALVMATHTTPSSPPSPVRELITGWYSSGADVPDTAFVPGDWNDTPQRRKLYLRVVARSCRTCHAAFDDAAEVTLRNWSDFPSRRNAIASLVQKGKMPHALITYMNFHSKNLWSDGTGPQVLQCFLDHIAKPGPNDPPPDETAMNQCIDKIP